MSRIPDCCHHRVRFNHIAGAQNGSLRGNSGYPSIKPHLDPTFFQVFTTVTPQLLTDLRQQVGTAVNPPTVSLRIEAPIWKESNPKRSYRRATILLSNPGTVAEITRILEANIDSR